MKKRKGWVWTLGFTIAFALSTVGALTATDYVSFSVWPQMAVLFIICAILTIVLRSKAKKEETQWQAAKDKENEERLAREKAIKDFQERYYHVRFPVAGVTFQNKDKTDRQKILLEISFNEIAETEVWLEDEEPDLGDESGIRVLTDYGCVGYIRRSDKAEVRRFTGKPVSASYLSVEQFINDEGKKIYRADVVFVLDRKNPGQQWYFDDLQ